MTSRALKNQTTASKTTKITWTSETNGGRDRRLKITRHGAIVASFMPRDWAQIRRSASANAENVIVLLVSGEDRTFHGVGVELAPPPPPAPVATISPELAALAVKHLGDRFAVLEERGLDSLDFHDASATGVRDLILEAFELGRQSVKAVRS